MGASARHTCRQRMKPRPLPVLLFCFKPLSVTEPRDAVVRPLVGGFGHQVLLTLEPRIAGALIIELPASPGSQSQ
jgi:hypothetical protein